MNIFKSRIVIYSIVILGLCLRFLVATRGHNGDFDSYIRVIKIVEQGENVYKNTTSYNYSPIWFYMLDLLFNLSFKDVALFRYVMTGFLSFVDFFIFFIMFKKYNGFVASVFFLNPISIIISGYHNQFDNFALVVGMLSTLLIGDNFDKGFSKQKWFGIVLLSLSICIKHVLFAFPFWLAIKQKGKLNKIFILLVPILIFFASFIPFWGEGKQGIIQNVLLYKSYNNECFYKLFLPDIVKLVFSSQMIWLIVLTIFAFIFKNKNSFDSLLIYSYMLVMTSPAIANQYLMIPMPFIATNLNLFTIIYMISGCFFLLSNFHGLHIYALHNMTSIPSNRIYEILVVLLTFGFIWSIKGENIKNYIIKTITPKLLWLSQEK